MARTSQANGLDTRPPGNEDGRYRERAGPTLSLIADFPDRCPHCSSTRYMNRNLKLLTNSVCYHKLCETCVDRLFGPGPRPCPYAGCGRTIRRMQFRVPTFGDLQIEREVDIRRRVASIFNRRQEEFLDLRSWNDYLENVETLTFNLLYNIDVEETEAKLNSYAAQNSDSIKKNKMLEEQERSGFIASLESQRMHRKLARQESLQEEEEERRERLKEDKEAQDRIRRGLDPRGAFTKNVARKKAGPSSKDVAAASVDSGGPVFEIQGLRPAAASEARKPFDPFGGYVITPKYYTLHKSYDHPWLENARNDPKTTAGGYDVGEYCARAMMEAFAGLGVFIGDEAGFRETETSPVEAAAAAAS